MKNYKKTVIYLFQITVLLSFIILLAVVLNRFIPIEFVNNLIDSRFSTVLFLVCNIIFGSFIVFLINNFVVSKFDSNTEDVTKGITCSPSFEKKKKKKLLQQVMENCQLNRKNEERFNSH